MVSAHRNYANTLSEVQVALLESKASPLENWYRFWSRVEKTPTCWNWIGRLSYKGYGEFDISNECFFSHRFAYQLIVGPLSTYETIDHLCRNRKCVNPSHMEPVTATVNTLRGFGPTAINRRKTHCYRGHPFDELNTRILTLHGKVIGKRCRQCRRDLD